MVRAIHLRVLPETRGECRGGMRPCPLVSCRHHLLLVDVTRAVGGQLGETNVFFSRDFDENDADSITDALMTMAETCSLDVADMGGLTSQGVGELLGIGVSAVEKIQNKAARAIRASGTEFDEREHPEDFYTRYSNMGANELAEVTAELRRRAKRGFGGSESG